MTTVEASCQEPGIRHDPVFLIVLSLQTYQNAQEIKKNNYRPTNQHTTSNFKNIWKDYVQKTLELLWQYTFEVSCLFRSFMDYSCSLSFDCTYLLKTKKITLQIMLMLQPHTSLVTQHKKFQKIYLVLPKKMFSRFANNQMIAKQNIVLGKCYIILSSPD